MQEVQSLWLLKLFNSFSKIVPRTSLDNGKPRLFIRSSPISDDICLWFKGMPWQSITSAFLAKTFFFSLFTHLKISYSSPMNDPMDRLGYFLLLAWDALLLSTMYFYYRKGSWWVFSGIEVPITGVDSFAFLAKASSSYGPCPSLRVMSYTLHSSLLHLLLQ